jgi:hypothetical protein
MKDFIWLIVGYTLSLLIGKIYLRWWRSRHRKRMLVWDQMAHQRDQEIEELERLVRL